MKWCICILTCCLLGITARAQDPVKQAAGRKSKDIQVSNNGYVVFLSSADMLQALRYIDSATGEQHTAAIRLLQQGRVKQADLQHATDQDVFADALKKCAGAWLMLHGKAYVMKNGKHVPAIVADAAPDIVALDGTVLRTVFFSEPGNSTAIFYGDIRSEVDH